MQALISSEVKPSPGVTAGDDTPRADAGLHGDDDNDDFDGDEEKKD